jgi:hypothetical protein
MRSTDKSQSRPKGISLIEAAMFLSICGVIAGGAVKYYAVRQDNFLAAGTDRLVKTLSAAQMNQACPEQEPGAAPSCRMFGDYRVRQTHDDSWTISRVSVEGGGVSDRELVLVSGGKLYASETIGRRQIISAQFEAIKGVVGKSAREIAAQKS